MYYTRNFWETLWSIVVDVTSLVLQIGDFLLGYSLLIVWTVWWLWGVNWPRFGDALRRGAWAPFFLLLVVAALVWSRLSPGSGRFLGITLPTFWWQLGWVAVLTGYTFFLGWLQGVMHWTPPEISLEPPAHAHHDHHGHDHGHHHAADHGDMHLGHDSAIEPPADTHAH